MKYVILTILVFGGIVCGPALPPAHAESCKGHLAKHNISADGDIQYHKLYGGKSPCGKDNGYKDGDERHTDKPMEKNKDGKSDSKDSGSDGYRRDKFGYGCGLFGCG